MAANKCIHRIFKTLRYDVAGIYHLLFDDELDELSLNVDGEKLFSNVKVSTICISNS